MNEKPEDTDEKNDWRKLAYWIAYEYHAYGLLTHHGSDRGWNEQPIEDCSDSACVEFIRLRSEDTLL